MPNIQVAPAQIHSYPSMKNKHLKITQWKRSTYSEFPEARDYEKKSVNKILL